MEILKVENLTKIYGKGENKVEALKDINLSVNKGEFVAIVGASGSGKSTLLHLLGGLDRPTAGKVIIEGENIYGYKENRLAVFRRRKIGFVFQFFNLIPVLDVEENISLPALLDNDRVDEKYLEEIIKLLGLEERKKHLPSELSGGQQQRVSIGRALLNKPSMVLADEPTGNLDSKNSKEVIELLKYTAKKYNQTLVLITHDINIASMADRIVTIEDGHIISDKRLQND
ncbi:MULTISPECIES: ABC transporter ATP-binding protein [Clostridium]|jgi:putative ABC transport system ATP-binding protein|uniref:Lipoprotein-releasing system ATP-binding protein LolD n=2 Tax=Clostridium TaxID=1485 RepID=A0A2T0BF20_9CLOT|nr:MULTISPECIES: ABC transporter ATP-binding protein [Clostridium]MCC9295818.1 ABC transporter ATP-binding protein [Clostridium aromativorans]MCI1945176.1 ABC transporter ATP-binding protein [Clostridium luticellarii]MCI1968862.1 ABC transporter ATP-binding protein [Clostridium luticellarii]MCI1995648.1 ABC transporter ATP-binding protein [Clostridium luticellarii]MCI2040036.1 ABC transporter ATP-binding protein [Clostridium luticellarii]